MKLGDALGNGQALPGASGIAAARTFQAEKGVQTAISTPSPESPGRGRGSNSAAGNHGPVPTITRPADTATSSPSPRGRQTLSFSVSGTLASITIS